MDYLEISITVRAEDAESAAGILLGVGFTGVVMGEERFDDLPEPWIEEPGRSAGSMPERPAEVTLRVYDARTEDTPAPLPEQPDAVARVRDALGNLARRTSTRVMAEESWAESWKRFWDVQHVGRHLVIKPSWKEYEASAGDLVIELDPKQAFGTGTHATTRLCLAALEGLVRPGDRVYDVGTGSGILAIAAVLLEAIGATGVDSDPVAVAAARENADHNGVSDRIDFAVGSASNLAGRADVVVANILAEILIELAADLAALTSRDLILSGIIDRKASDVRAAFEGQGLVLADELREDGWVAQHFLRP